MAAISFGLLCSGFQSPAPGNRQRRAERLIEAGNSEMGTADARCHLMACCANGEGEVEAGDDDRSLVLRAGEMDEEQLRRRGTLICWRAG